MVETGSELRRLNELAAEYRRAQQAAKDVRRHLDQHIQDMKRAGYSFPVLARESGLAQGTVHNIVASDRNSHQYWRQRCARKGTAEEFCDVRFPDQPSAWCNSCTVARQLTRVRKVDTGDDHLSGRTEVSA